MTAAPPAGTRPELGWPTMLLYGFGAVANTVKARGLGSFLMIFYNQVLHLDPRMVGLATSIALIFDAFIDPTVGQISDNVRTPWGRRHPFMYAAALPVAIAFFLLWNPPTGWQGMQLFGYMLACLLTIRLFDTFFELPSNALLPELVTDYHKRTTLISIRQLFGVIGGVGTSILALQVFMSERNVPGGMLARDGYISYATFAAVVMVFAILISSAATHRFIPYLRQAPVRKISAGLMFSEVLQTVKNHAFMVATLSGMFTAVAVATRNQLEFYFGLFFWGLNQSQLAALTLATAIGAIIGLLWTPLWSRRLGKKYGAIAAYSIALAIGLLPIGLRLLHVMPPNGSDLLFIILAVENVANAAFAITTAVLLSSMIADIVEDSEVKTGRRSEGLLFSADQLFKKITSAAGPIIAGQILYLVQFPDNARRTGVTPEVLHNLALVYLPTAALLYGTAIVCLFLFRLDKTSHEANLRTLDERAAAALVDSELTPDQGPGRV